MDQESACRLGIEPLALPWTRRDRRVAAGRGRRTRKIGGHEGPPEVLLAAFVIYLRRVTGRGPVCLSVRDAVSERALSVELDLGWAFAEAVSAVRAALGVAGAVTGDTAVTAARV